VPYTDGVSLVQQVKERHKIENLFTELIPSSNGYMMARCPFHEDNSPSFWIDTKRQIANCNKCQFSRPMDVINLYAKMQGVDDQTALRMLANLA
jgi:DNA primase